MQLKPLKIPKTFEEQVRLLEEKGFVISDEQSCLRLLHHVNYYNLSAYLLPFKTNRENEYEQGVPFEQVQKMYEFDRKIRTLLFSAIEEIELYLRTQLSYYHANTYCATAYLNPELYNHRHDHKKFMQKIKDCFEQNQKSLVVKHHIDAYNGHFPIWVIIEYFSIGMLSYFYADLLSADKKKLAKELYDISPPYLESWLKCLTVLRNKCAHYSRLYFWNFKDYPKIPKQYSLKPTMKLFDQLLTLKFLYTNRLKWDNLILTDLSALIEEYQDYIRLCDIGFPDDWKRLLSNFHHKEITIQIIE